MANLGTYTELRTTSFIESTGVACSDSVSHNRVQVLSIPVLLPLAVRLQVQTLLLASNRILNTCTRLWLTESEQATPVDSIKEVLQNSM